MYELDHRKDQIMTICKLATSKSHYVDPRPLLSDHLCPGNVAEARAFRVALPGRVTRGPATVQVELRPFNDRQLNRDLVLLCERVNGAQPRLPDGRVLVLSISRG